MGFEGCGVFGVLAMRIRVWLAMSINYEHKGKTLERRDFLAGGFSRRQRQTHCLHSPALFFGYLASQLA